MATAAGVLIPRRASGQAADRVRDLPWLRAKPAAKAKCRLPRRRPKAPTVVANT